VGSQEVQSVSAPDLLLALWIIHAAGCRVQTAGRQYR
jgi:hypothetical protein